MADTTLTRGTRARSGPPPSARAQPRRRKNDESGLERWGCGSDADRRGRLARHRRAGTRARASKQRQPQPGAIWAAFGRGWPRNRGSRCSRTWRAAALGWRTPPAPALPLPRTARETWHEGRAELRGGAICRDVVAARRTRRTRWASGCCSTPRRRRLADLERAPFHPTAVTGFAVIEGFLVTERAAAGGRDAPRRRGARASSTSSPARRVALADPRTSTAATGRRRSRRHGGVDTAIPERRAVACARRGSTK